MNGDEFVEQIQDVQKRVAELQQNTDQLPQKQKSRLTESLERLTNALRDLQVAEEAIQLLLSAVQQSRDSIVITTANLNSPGPEMVYVNPAFSRMTGYRIEESLGKTPRFLQGPNTDRALLDRLRQALEQGKPFHGEAINYHKDGSEYYVEWNITPIRNAHHDVTHFVAIQRDITERKRLEEEREHLLRQEQAARDEAEAASRTKDDFLAMLSHELRTPLTPILGWAKVLRTKQLPEAKFQEALETIEQNAKLQAQLVDDLLDLSRIVQGKLALNLEPVSLIKPIANALDTVRFAADAKSIRIKTKLDSNVGQIMGDAGRLQQVIWNLLTNAIKFTPSQGSIAVNLERSLSEPSRANSMAQITVSDTGQGINLDFLPFVFDRFRQEDSSITRQFGGLGLGLSLSRQLIEAHGGTIAATSAGAGQGTTITIQLPLSAHMVSSAQMPTEPSVFDLYGVRVLVVEDEPSTLKFLAFLLEQEGAVVTGVPSAQEALSALEQDPFDILVSDIGLEGVDGYALLQQIRTASRSHQVSECVRQLPAIALTAYASESGRQKALETGYQQHLVKPIEPEVLIRAIAAALSRQV
ncbi:MAG: PAS domain S-box protein [Myxacorys californica WJT36-NPBG1]|nr:PAS domain S-box protein [Myxacorys californica WJT36-NPBG1]